MALACKIWSLLLLFLVTTPSKISGAEESHKLVEQLNITSLEKVTVSNPVEASVKQNTVYRENAFHNFINAIMQIFKNQPWKTDLRKTTSNILERFVIPAFKSSNVVWFYNETMNVIHTIKLYINEEKLGWIYNASLNAVNTVIPPFNVASWREAYSETMNSVDSYLFTPKRVLYTALAVSVAMNPTVVSWFQYFIANLVGLVDNTLFVATGRGLSRSFWSTYPDLRYPSYSKYQRSANYKASDTVADILYEVAAAVAEQIGDLYLW